MAFLAPDASHRQPVERKDIFTAVAARKALLLESLDDTQLTSHCVVAWPASHSNWPIHAHYTCVSSLFLVSNLWQRRLITRGIKVSSPHVSRNWSPSRSAFLIVSHSSSYPYCTVDRSRVIIRLRRCRASPEIMTGPTSHGSRHGRADQVAELGGITLSRYTSATKN